MKTKSKPRIFERGFGFSIREDAPTKTVRFRTFEIDYIHGEATNCRSGDRAAWVKEFHGCRITCQVTVSPFHRGRKGDKRLDGLTDSYALDKCIVAHHLG